MEHKERKRRLAHAEKQFIATTRRIKRLLTAQRSWNKRVEYHREQLAKETVEAKHLYDETLQQYFVKPLPQIEGRKFR